MCFKDSYEADSALEVKTEQNKYFKIERFTSCWIKGIYPLYQQYSEKEPLKKLEYRNIQRVGMLKSQIKVTMHPVVVLL